MDSDESLFRKIPGDPEEWQSPQFFGDFYREPDNVCRGLTLAAQDVSAPGQIPFKGFNPLTDGDFYREPDDICKGISIGAGFDPFSKDAQFSGSTTDSYSNVLAEKADINAERFMDTDFPPSMPNDSFFKLEVTNLSVISPKPYEVGNLILDYLQEAPVVAILTKPVRRAKFAIKAEVFLGEMMCTTKIRVYDQGSGKYAVEFQRRSGDAITFNRTFHGASTYLTKHSVTVLNGPEAPISLQPPPLPDSFMGTRLMEVDLMPILDMAGLVGTPSLQAEAASSLCKMAEDGNPALWSGSVFTGIHELMQTSSTEVAVPTARLIYNLAQHMEAVPFFATHNLMPAVLDKIRSPDTHPQVCLQLAKALNAAIQRQSKATLAASAAAELRRALFECSEMGLSLGPLSYEVMHNLKMGADVLESKFEASA